MYFFVGTCRTVVVGYESRDILLRPQSNLKFVRHCFKQFVPSDKNILKSKLLSLHHASDICVWKVT